MTGKTCVAAAFGLVLALAVLTGPAARAEGLVLADSPYPMAVTVARLEAAVTGRGLGIAARIDHRAAARRAGLDLAPTVVLLFGNPAIGTPLMAINQQIGLDLPLRVVVFAPADGRVRLGYRAPRALAAAWGVAVDHPSILKMKKGLAVIIAEVVAKP